MYRFLYWLVLGRLPAEFAHRALFAALRISCAIPGVRALVGWICKPRDPALRVRALGLDFTGPLGLAAGFDKDARGADALLALGFGFNNRGADAAAVRLARRRGRVIGVNLGKTKIATDEIADYVASASKLGALADYVVVNVSSPNTPGLRDLQSVSKLGPLLAAVRAALPSGKPLLVKIAPDLADADVDAVADLALAQSLDGIIATNTTIARTGLVTPDVERLGAGGLSGRPLKARSLEVLRRLRARVGDRLILVAVGGIEDADDAWARIRAGATLVQAYTGFVYGGPLWPRRVQRGLVARARAAGFERVQDAVGSDTMPR